MIESLFKDFKLAVDIIFDSNILELLRLIPINKNLNMIVNTKNAQIDLFQSVQYDFRLLLLQRISIDYIQSM